MLLPALSKTFWRGEKESFAKSLNDALRSVSFVIWPCAFVMFYFAESLVQVLFERGAFTPSHTAQTAQAIRAYCVGLWAVSSHSMLVRGFLAMKDTKTPALIALLTLTTSFCLALGFMGAIESENSGVIYAVITALQATLLKLPLIGSLFANINLSHAGLALASSLAAYLSLVIAALVIVKRCPQFKLALYAATSVKCILACCGMLAFLHLLEFNKYSGAVSLLVGLPLSALSYLIFSKILKIKELEETFALIRRIR